jgi:dTMP kinase
MTRNNARFIVFEGLDGAGTTTQAARLHDHCTRSGTSGFLTNEPTSEPIGAFIRRLLSRNEIGQDGGPYRPNERAMGLLFAADRLAHSQVIEAALSRGSSVICDRYLLSSVAYQTLDSSISADWVINVNYGCIVPDLTLFLAVPVDACLARIRVRAEEASIYETRALLETISANYERLLPLYAKQFGRVVRIDGSGSVDDVHAAVVAAVLSR